MTDLPHSFVEDRALRDAARAVFLADLEHAKGALSRKGLPERLTDWLSRRLSLGLKDTVEVAAAGVNANRSGIAILVAALIVWFSRDTIMEVLGVQDPETGAEPDGDAEPGGATAASGDELSADAAQSERRAQACNEH